MSATYRIDVRKSGEAHYPWKANVYRLSDDAHRYAAVGDTRDEAVNDARQMIARENAAPEPFSLLVDDQGRDAEAPQSVKVP